MARQRRTGGDRHRCVHVDVAQLGMLQGSWAAPVPCLRAPEPLRTACRPCLPHCSSPKVWLHTRHGAQCVQALGQAPPSTCRWHGTAGTPPSSAHLSVLWRPLRGALLPTWSSSAQVGTVT